MGIYELEILMKDDSNLWRLVLLKLHNIIKQNICKINQVEPRVWYHLEDQMTFLFFSSKAQIN